MKLKEIDKLFGISKSTRIRILWFLLVINIMAITKPSPNSEKCNEMFRYSKTCPNYNNYFLFATTEYHSREVDLLHLGIFGFWIKIYRETIYD